MVDVKETAAMGGFIGAALGATYCLYQGALKLLTTEMKFAVITGVDSGIRTVQDLTLKSTGDGILQYSNNVLYKTALTNAQNSLSQFHITDSAKTFLFRELGKGVVLGALGGALIGTICAVALNRFMASQEKKNA